MFIHGQSPPDSITFSSNSSTLSLTCSPSIDFDMSILIIPHAPSYFLFLLTVSHSCLHMTTLLSLLSFSHHVPLFSCYRYLHSSLSRSPNRYAPSQLILMAWSFASIHLPLLSTISISYHLWYIHPPLFPMLLARKRLHRRASRMLSTQREDAELSFYSSEH